MAHAVKIHGSSVRGSLEVYLHITETKKNAIQKEVRAQLDRTDVDGGETPRQQLEELDIDESDVHAAVFQAVRAEHPVYVDRDLDDPELWNGRDAIKMQKAFHVVRYLFGDVAELVISIMPKSDMYQVVDRVLGR